MSENGSYGIGVDASGVIRLMDALSPDELAQTTRQALRSTAAAIQKAVQREYRAQYPGSVLWRAVHMSAWRSGKGAEVDINPAWFRKYGKGDPLYRSYILPTLEQGNYKTSPRRAKRNRNYRNYSASSFNRGNIAGTRFFRRGVESSVTAARIELQGKIENALARRINRLAQR